MSPEEFEQKVNAAIKARLDKGFRLYEGTFGTCLGGCALTALAIEDGVEFGSVDRVPGEVESHAIAVAYGRDGVDQEAKIKSFIEGFDACDEDASNITWSQAGRRVRERWKDWIK